MGMWGDRCGFAPMNFYHSSTAALASVNTTWCTGSECSSLLYVVRTYSLTIISINSTYVLAAVWPLLAHMMWPSAWPQLGLSVVVGHGRAIDWARHWAKASLAHIWPISGDRPGAGLAQNEAFIHLSLCFPPMVRSACVHATASRHKGIERLG